MTPAASAKLRADLEDTIDWKRDSITLYRFRRSYQVTFLPTGWCAPPDRPQADRSFARHQASEDSSQTCTRRERTFIMSAKIPDFSWPAEACLVVAQLAS